MDLMELNFLSQAPRLIQLLYNMFELIGSSITSKHAKSTSHIRHVGLRWLSTWAMLCIRNSEHVSSAGMNAHCQHHN